MKTWIDTFSLAIIGIALMVAGRRIHNLEMAVWAIRPFEPKVVYTNAIAHNNAESRGQPFYVTHRAGTNFEVYSNAYWSPSPANDYRR